MVSHRLTSDTEPTGLGGSTSAARRKIVACHIGCLTRRRLGSGRYNVLPWNRGKLRLEQSPSNMGQHAASTIQRYAKRGECHDSNTDIICSRPSASNAGWN